MMYQYQPGDSWFHKLNPLPKFVWLICMSVLAIRYEDAGAQLLLMAVTLLFGLVACKLTLPEIWRRIWIPLLFSLPYFLLQLLFVPGETELWQLGKLVITAEAFDFALAITLRLLILLMVTLWFILTTDPSDVVLALVHQLRVPYRFAFALSIALRFLPILHAEAEITRAAHRRRGLPHGLKNRLAWWRRFIFAVFVSAVRNVQQMAEAMEVRGFGRYPERTFRRKLKKMFAGIYFASGSLMMTAVVLIMG